jgi:subtilisin family serine protease
MKKKFFLLLLFVGCGLINSKEEWVEMTKRENKIKNIYAKIQSEQSEIDNLINKKHPSLKRDRKNNIIRPDGITLSGKPVYYKSYHGKSQVELLKAHKVKNNSGVLNLNLNGEGIQVHIWDSKSIFATHQEFVDPDTGNTIIETQSFESQSMESSHGTKVASTIIARGLAHNENYDVTGIAPKLSKLKYFNSTNDRFEILNELEENPDFIISNHSYGYYILNDEGEQVFDAWEIGEYGNWDQFIDETSNLFPYWLYVQGTGNEGDISYEGQEHAGYDYMVDGLNAKNQLNVASINLNKEFGDFISPSRFSSSGPTNDVRIKPEISALGKDVYCATWNKDEPTETNWYSNANGTSFSGPAVAGGAALMQQYYKQLNNNYMLSSTLRGLICHTATDLTMWGAKKVTGPDPKTGYGLMNIEAAIELIKENKTDSEKITERALTNNEVFNLSYITSTESSDKKLIVTLAWNDPFKPELLIDGDLVNDLDVRVYNDDGIFYPWKLDTADITAPALKGDNLVDNLEKIEIDAPNGNYIIEVSHKGILEEDQVFSLIVSGNGEVTTLSNKTIEKINTIFTSYSKAERKIIVQSRVPSVKTEKYEMYDITGRLINEKRLNGTNNFKIDAANLNKGVYLIRIKTDLSILTSKVIVD